jgi:hypothetical protein
MIPKSILLFLILVSGFIASAQTKKEPYRIEYIDADSTYLELGLYDTIEKKYLQDEGIFTLENIPLVKEKEGKSRKIESYSISDEEGNHKKNRVKEGDYILDFNGSVRFEISLEKNKLNRITALVSKPTLQFSYADHPNITMLETATVTPKFSKDLIDTQLCSEKKIYETGEYYLSVNTIPLSKFSLELTYGGVYEIQVPLPGKLTLIKSKDINQVSMYYLRGDEYYEIEEIDLNSNEKITLQILPRPYIIQWTQNGKKFEETIRIDAGKDFVFDFK